MSHGDHRSHPTGYRPRNRPRAVAWAALTLFLSLASVPALAQYKYRRSITVDRTKVRNPALLPIAFDKVTSAKTADAGASNLAWTHTVGSGADKLAIVSVSTVPTAVTITADAGSSLGFAGLSSGTLSYTVGAGSNKALIVGVSIRNNSGQTVSSVTWGGTALSPIGATGVVGNVRVELWGLLGPTPGTANVIVTLSAAANFVVGATSFSNVGEIATTRSLGARASTGTTASVTITSAPGELVVDVMGNVVTDAAGAPTVSIGGGQTANFATTYIPSQVRGSGSRRVGASPNVTMSWTFGVNANWAIRAVPLVPAVVTQVMFGATNITANVIGTVTNSGNCSVSMYYLKNPTQGDNTVSVTTSASTRFVAGAFSLFNVDQTTPFGTFASGTGSGVNTDPASVSILGASGEVIVAGLAKRYNYAVWPEQSTHQADRWQLSTGLGTANDILGVGTLRGGEASAQAYWALTGASTQQWAIGGVPVKPTTVAPAQITTLSNYPLLVSLSDTTLRDVAHSGHVQSASGYDIVFRASDGVTQLDHELEKYDGTNGQVVAWVRLPSVNGAAAASDTTIFMYYGNTGISSPTQNKTAVWDTNYMDVFHLAETSGSATDSTSHAYTATVQGTGTPTHPAAKIDGGFGFAGDSWLLTNDGQFTVANAPFTIESWFYIASGTPTWVGIATKNRDVSCNDNPPYCDWAGVWIGGSGELTYAWDWHNQGNMDGGAALSTGTWYYGAIVFDGGMRTGYRNGARDTVITAPNPAPGTYIDLVMPTRINKDLDAGAMLTGTIDEVRVSRIARTPGWILTTWDNMNNPGNIGTPGFYTVGSEVEIGSPLITYSENGSTVNNQIYYSLYQGTNWTAGAYGVTDPSGDYDAYYKVARTNPSFTKQAVVWKNSNPGGRRIMLASIWDGTNWDDGTGSPYGDVKNFGQTWESTATEHHRSFDAAFEQVSGDLLVVSGINTSNSVYYWIWNSSSWSGPTFGTIQNNSSTFRWCRLAPRPGFDEIAFIGSSDNGSVSVGRWTGSAWHNGHTRITSGGNIATDAIDVQYVQAGSNVGDIVAVWGQGQYVYASIYTDDLASWSANTQVADLGSGNTAKWLKLKANPDRDDLVLAVGGSVSSTFAVYTIPYEGDSRAFGSLSSAHTTAGFGNSDYNRPFDVIWDPGSGSNNVLLVYSDGTGLRYKTSSDRGTTWSSQQNISASNEAYWMQLERSSNRTIHLAVHDDFDDLRTWTWASSTWTPKLTISTDLELGYNSNREVEVFALAGALQDTRSFGFRRPITIPNSMTPGVCGADLSSFPVLVSTTDATLRSVANGGHVQSANGYDIIFRGSDGVTWLDHEFERYDPVTGQLVAWVRIPTLAYNADTTIYMYYGNAAISAPTANPTGVWNTVNGWRAVWHLSESPTGAAGQLKDSTSNSNNGTTSGGMVAGNQVTGVVDGSLDFDGIDDYVDAGNNASLQLTGAMTLSAWVRADTFAPDLPGNTNVSSRFLTKSGDEPQRGWELDRETADSKAHFIISADGTSPGQRRVISTADVPTGQWVQYVGVYEPSTAVRIYVNGVLNNSNTTSIPASQYNAANNVRLAARTDCNNCYLDGKLDEVRVSSVARDACWIGTEYNSAATPASIGSEEPLSDYKYERPITISNAMTPASCGSNLTDFPVPVSITDLTLRSVQNGGHVQNASGYDIIFRAYDDTTCGGAGTSPCTLDHEIERYTATTGQLVAWVRLPGLAYNGDTTISMRYGNPAITLPTANPTGVWNSAYKAVWHLSETSGVHYDSTSNNNDSTSVTVTTQGSATGRIDGADDFNGSADYIIAANTSSSLNVGQDFTAEAWVKKDTMGARTVLTKTYSDQYTFKLSFTGSDYLRLDVNTGSGYNNVQGDTITDTAWHYVGGYSDGTAIRVFADGVVHTNSNSTPASSPYDAGSLFIGAGRWSSNPVDYFDGIIDEVRISTIARDACWIGTTHNSMATPPSVGGEGAAGPTAIELISLDAVEVPGRGVRVSWRTGFEVDNLGFHVYREVGGERVRLTPSLVAGSALFAGAGTALTAGQSYSWWDASPVAGASYWLEEWDLSGEKRWHGPVSVQPGEFGGQAQALGAPAVGGSGQTSSPLLSGLGQSGSGSVEHRVRRRLRQGVSTGDERLLVQWGLASRPAVKILVSEDGWYRVSQEEVVRAGLDPGVDPGRLQLFADGLQVPILVDVRQQGRFASGDGIEFFGEGLDTPATAVQVYWLVSGPGSGERIPEAGGAGGWSEGPASFPAEVERADRTLYFPAFLNGEESNFFGAVVSETPVTQAVRVPHVEPSSPGELVVRLAGATVGAHRVGVELNGVRLGTVVWEGMTVGELALPVGPGMILEGDNQVTLTAEGGEGDISALESIRVRYAHTWQADSDALEFTLGGYQQVTINGFRGSAIEVLDITDPWAVQALPAEVVKEGASYQVTVGVPEAGERTLLAVGTAGIRHPVGVLPNRPSSWHAASEGADLVIIAHRSLLPAVEPLRALRESQGLKVLVVDVESVFDEFSYGARDPQAIKDFLACAKEHWSRPPRYLLLVGDASFDPRNYLGFGWADLVPTKLVDTTYMETASDDWFADFDGDGIADLGVGRIPVQIASEATTAIGKIVAYDGGARFGRVLLLADVNDEGNDFEGLSAQVKAALPATVWVSEVYRGQVGDAAAKSELASSLNIGQTVINYLGHGSVEVWHGNWLTTDEAHALRNYWYPFVISMTCLNGFFHGPQTEGLGEALVEGPGGAVAVWASSGLTESEAQVTIDEALVRLLFSGTTTLGDATRAAKAATSDMDVRRTWILFGDPTTRLRR